MGTVESIWVSAAGAVYVDIKRDGYREIAVIPAEKASDSAYVFWV
jgi:hypothetical protein